MRPSLLLRGALVGLLGVSGCSGPREAERVELAVVVAGAELEPVTTDLGYRVEVSGARLVVDDLKFHVAGEVHASLLRRLSDALIPVAHAHPGHYQGGEITGELPGHFVLEFPPGGTSELGPAVLLTGKYHSASFTLSRAAEGDVAEDDSLLGHTALIEGVASKGEREIAFEVRVDSPEGREILGIPFEAEVTAARGQVLSLRLLTRDPREDDSLFDGLDFELLDGDADGAISITPSATEPDAVAAYNLIRRTLQTHDHFAVVRHHPDP